MANPTDERRILLGQIIGAHGIRGDVTVRTYTANPADVAAYGALTDAAGASPLTLSILRTTDKGVVARVKGVADRNAAEALKGRELFVARSKLPSADASEFYHADLIGLAAVTAAGQPFGRVIAVQNFGAGDLLEIRLSDAKDSEYIPFTDACVPQVDIAAGVVTIVPPLLTGDAEAANDDDAPQT
jgi:16S rRNA processing protein RimM